MSKEFALMRDVVCRYHPDYLSRSSKKKALANPSHYNVEHLVELTMAHVGGYKFVDGDLHDFSDGSECKTASIEERLNGLATTSHPGMISGIMTKSGAVKQGHLRNVIYNPHLDELLYIFLPKDVWDPYMREFGQANKNKLRFTWNSDKNIITKFKGYYCTDFVQLAKSRS